MYLSMLHTYRHMCENICKHERGGIFTFTSRKKITSVVLLVLLSVGPSNCRKASLPDMIIWVHLLPVSALLRLEKELSTFLTWLERCEAIASSPEGDIPADRVKVESELQLTQASSRRCGGNDTLFVVAAL